MTYPPTCVCPPPIEKETKMTANELSTELACFPCVTQYHEEIRDKSAQELRTLSSANKWQADQIEKLKTLNSWQASEINLFSADLKKSIVELHADSEIALLFSTEQLQQANARIADFEKELFEIGCIVENLQMKLQLRNMSIGLLEKEGNNKTLCIRSLIKLQDILVVKLSQYESIIKLAEVK